MKIMNIGGVNLPSRAVMAPIAGITDRPLRTIVMAYGAGMVTSELLSANALVRGSAKTQHMLPSANEPRPVAAQIFGGDPAVMRDAAAIVQESPCDIIDLNFGCPVKKVTKCGGGAAILKDVEQAERIAAAVVNAVAKPVTVKIRSGWGANGVNAVEVAKALEGAGVAAVTLHARTAVQGYAGFPDWSLIAETAAAVGIPIIGNGDVHTPEEALDRLNSSGCACVMIGRGALAAPWVFRQFNQLAAGGSYDPATLEEMKHTALRLFAMMTEEYGERPAVRRMRTRLGYLSKGLPGGARFREAINHTLSADALRALIGDFFSETQRALV